MIEAFGMRISSIGITDIRPAHSEELLGINVQAPRLTGRQLFDRMSRAEQDTILGPDIAEAVRTGKVRWEDLVVRAPLETEPDFIRQATPADLGLDKENTE